MTWLTAREVAQMRADAEELMPDTCTILSVAYTSDGEGGMTEAWGTATASVKCRLDFITSHLSMGREVVVGGAVQPYTSAVLSLPYDTVITPANRVTVNGDTFAVKSVNDGQSWIIAVRARLERV